MPHLEEIIHGVDVQGLPIDLAAERSLLVTRMLALVEEAKMFASRVSKLRGADLAERWEACKASYCLQRTERDRAAAVVAALESELIGLHREFGVSKLELLNFQPAPDRFASAEAIAEVEAHRAKLQEAMAAAARAIGVLEQQLIRPKSLANFQQERLNNLEAEEDQIAIQIGRLNNPDQRQFNAYGLSTAQPARAQVSGGLGLMG
jgi:hypothetical protein